MSDQAQATLLPNGRGIHNKSARKARNRKRSAGARDAISCDSPKENGVRPGTYAVCSYSAAIRSVGRLTLVVLVVLVVVVLVVVVLVALAVVVVLVALLVLIQFPRVSQSSYAHVHG